LSSTITFRPGLKPARPGQPRLRLADYIATTPLPATPPSADWISHVPEWPMYGNDTIGDCGPAGLGHVVESVTTYAQGHTVEVTEQDVIDFYSEVSGFRPGDESTDVGVVLQDMLGYALKHTFAGHEIVAFAAVDVSNATEVQLGIDLFDAVITGINLPKSAEDQFNAGRPWDYVRGSRILGGHCVPVLRYDQSGIDGVTWAAVQRMTAAFWRRYVAEGWIVITREWADTKGKTPTGLDLHALGADFQALTGKQNPFPDAPPQPPSPVPADRDRTLAAAFDSWRQQAGV
jgi:hypothetical protein